MRLLFALLVSALTLTLIFAPAAQAQAFPQKPIRMVIPYPPGGPTDVPGKVNFASSSAASAPHLAGEHFKQVTGIDSAEEFAAFNRREMERWGRIVRAANIKLD